MHWRRITEYLALFLAFFAVELGLTGPAAADNVVPSRQRMTRSQLRSFKAGNWQHQIAMIRNAPNARVALAMAARHVKMFWDPQLPQERSKGVVGLVVGSRSIKRDNGAAQIAWAIGGSNVRPVSAEYRIYAVRGRLAIGGNEVRIDNGAMDDYWNTRRVRIDINKVSMADVKRLFPNLTPAAVADTLANPMWYQPSR